LKWGLYGVGGSDRWLPNPTLNPTGCQRGALAPLGESGAGGLVLALGVKMNSGISIKKVWSDDDLGKFAITSSDGQSLFRVDVYVGHRDFERVVEELDRFKSHVHGGIYDIRFGEFGPEYAGGAFHARLHFYEPGRGQLFITVHAESDWREFTTTSVASRTTLYFTSEPVLLDGFIQELKRLQKNGTDSATLLRRDSVAQQSAGADAPTARATQR
ncbi:MAG: hypothetical protein ACOYXU_14995, partial [Nitrospirota bacterium]